MSAAAKPLHKEVQTFVKAHLGKDAFAPFTGQDSPAWIAFVYLVQCYSHGGGEDAISAMRATVRCVQPIERVLRVFAQAIPAVMDWGDVARLWPHIVVDLELRGDRVNSRAYEICAHERYELRDCTTPQVRLHGWRPPAASARVTRGEHLPDTYPGGNEPDFQTLALEAASCSSSRILRTPDAPPCDGCPRDQACSDYELCARKWAR